MSVVDSRRTCEVLLGGERLVASSERREHDVCSLVERLKLRLLLQ